MNRNMPKSAIDFRLDDYFIDRASDLLSPALSTLRSSCTHQASQYPSLIHSQEAQDIRMSRNDIIVYWDFYSY